MRLLQINATYGKGSTGRIVKDLHYIAKHKGYESYVAASLTDDSSECYMIGNVVDHKIHALLSRIGGKQAYFSRYATWNLIKFIKKINPDIIHIHNLHNNYINLNMFFDYVNKERIPLVITLHDCWYYTGKCFHYTYVKCHKWETECSNCPKRKQDTPAICFDSTHKVFLDKKKRLENMSNLYVVGASKWISLEAQKSILHNAHITYCYNGVDIKTFYPREIQLARKKYHISEDDFVLLCMANKWEQPQNAEQQKALLSVLDTKTKLVVVGKCTEKSKMEDKVIYTGQIFNQDEMAVIYSMADIFINLTWEDTLPFVNIESLACGTPVITHKTSGATETIDESTGIAISPGNSNELKDAIVNLKNKGKQTLKEACVDRVKTCFNYDSAYEKYFAIYEEIINAK